ncbi:F-box domain-containing protein [Mycena venus]|uniref:F-box domain-containing protein n=1 Tax=Mycena venus TaxID=2733690 RepID=A0A8H7CF87_9AGAR|nr:F-box domain-containing protein [Mycena venus]
MSTMSDSAMRGIHSLPPELVCVLFYFVHASRSPIDRKPRVPLPVHTLTRVCTLWRDIAQRLPELWTDIRILNCRPSHPEMLDEYFTRSCNLQLDLLLDVPFDITGKQFAQFWGIILKIWSAASRWRSLCVITTAENFAYIQKNVVCRTAPRLESLQLRVSEKESSTDTQLAISFKSMSSLKSLVLHGITLENCDVSSFVDQLRRLDLCATSAAIIGQLAERFDTSLQGTQDVSRLRHLSLRATLPWLHGVTAQDLFKSYISSLTTLSLGNFHDNDFRLLCTLISTPVLEELSLNDLSRACWNIFTQVLTDQHLEFPALRTLKLSFIAGCTMHAHLALAFPSLEHLSLLHVDCSTFFSALSKPEPPILWPHLRSLAVDNADYRALCSVVEARNASGYSLTSLEIDTPPSLDTGSFQWLQNNVKAVKRNLPA